MSEDKYIIGGVSGGIGLIIFIVLFALCWDSIEPTEYGLKYYSFGKSVDTTKVYEGGIYFVFLAHSFIHFPRTIQNVEFSDKSGASSAPLQTRTKEGLALTLHVAFQYKLTKNQIPELYNLYNIYYEQTFIRIARDVILKKAGEYEANLYWEQRTKIGDEMYSELNTALAETNAQCIGLQLLQIDLPTTFENQIVLTQVEVQKKTIKQYEQHATIIRSQIDVDKSEAQKNITIINAEAEAQSYYLIQSAKASALNKTITYESNVYKNTSEALNLAGEEMIKFVYYSSLANLNNSKLLFGLNQSIVSLGMNSLSNLN